MLFKFVFFYIKKRNESEFLIENVYIDVLMKYCWIEKSMLEKFLFSKELFFMELLIGLVVFLVRYFKIVVVRICLERE